MTPAVLNYGDVLLWNAKLSCHLTVLLEVAQLTMNRYKATRTEHVDQELLFLLASMTRYVHLRHRVVEDIRASLEEPVDHAVDHLLVARDHVRGEHYGISLSNAQRVLFTSCQPAEDGHGLALCTGC